MRPKVEYYFDFLSPYSYLSWQWVRRNQENIEFSYFPVILGQVIHHYETKGPAEIEPKREYLFKHCLRYAQKHNIAFKAPKKLPFNSLYGLRMAVFENSGKNQFAVIDALFGAGWGHGYDIGNPDVLLSILKEAGLPAKELLDNVSDPSVRKALKNNVQQAHKKNIFGLPSFLAEPNPTAKPQAELIHAGERAELFWGNDSIEDLENYLAGCDKLSEHSFKEFQLNSQFS